MRSTRREFTTETKRQAVRRSGGVCECHLLGKRGIAGFSPDGCGLRIGIGNTWFEHVICDGIGGEPTLENCAVLSKTCGRLKSQTYDIPIVAKVKRQQNMRFGIKSDSGQPIPGSKRSAFRKKINGQVEWRT
jgi:5-methylcytosine-specific restriction enzyme A